MNLILFKFLLQFNKISQLSIWLNINGFTQILNGILLPYMEILVHIMVKYPNV